MVKFYGWFLMFLLGLATFAVLINREYFVTRPVRSALIATAILIFPALVYLLFRSFGSISKIFRLFIFHILRARVFALFGVVALAISLIIVLLYLIRGLPIQTVLLGSFVLINIVLFYLLALVRNGNFLIQEPTDFLFRHQNRHEVYLYINGEGRHIPDPPTLNLLGWSFANIIVLGNREFRAFRRGRPLESVRTARLVRPDDNENEVWMILENERRRVPDLNTLLWIQNLNPEDRTIEIITRDQLAAWREGRPLSSIIFHI